MAEASYGAWESPISPSLVARAGIRLSELHLAGGDTWWLESRPAEGGRSVVMRRSPDGAIAEITPAGFNVRTRVHEYGGGAYLVNDGTVFFSNFVDQRLYRQDPGAGPRAITPEPSIACGDRYADGRATPDGRLIVCVRERHHDGREADNEIVAISTDGSGEPRSIVSGADFYACPRISPDGRALCWISWQHPRMPWDGSELWLADFAADGAVSNARLVDGGPDVSVFQPAWSPTGVLHWTSDRGGWWNRRSLVDGHVQEDEEPGVEIGQPLWAFGLSRHAGLSNGAAVYIFSRDGRDYVHIAGPEPGRQLTISEYTSAGYLAASGNRVAMIAASPADPPAVIELDADTGATEVLHSSSPGGAPVDAGYISTPRPVEFPTDGGVTAHALFYPPRNRDFTGPAGELPPLIVMSHGGPTGATSSAFSLAVQFWTSRGFAVVDVNYGGSSGYGREYRQRLQGKWGIVDTADCINAARYLVGQGEVDGSRLAIRGGSAGGYTTLCALTFHDVFAAGASYFGVADAEALARDTHKFESRYLDGLIGPYPEARDVYRQRSPIHFTDRISCPLILFQGLEDQVVPPSQAEAMVKALREKKLPLAYLAFEGEQHGFRRAENIERTLEAELWFYGRIFGFTPAGDIRPVEIENFE